MIRVASASELRPELIQSMKYGPTSAATSAMMKAIASRAASVCTESPLEGAPAQTAPRELSAEQPQYIETSVGESQRDERWERPFD